MSDIKKILGTRIRQLRKLLGFTQEVLAERADLDFRTIGSVERGESNLSINSLEKVAQALEVSPSFLLDLTKDKKSLSEKELLIQELLYIFKAKEAKDLQLILDLTKRVFE